MSDNKTARDNGVASKDIHIHTHDRMAMKTSSRAEAKVLRMEFKFLRNKLVTMPTAALLRIITTTLGFHTYKGTKTVY